MFNADVQKVLEETGLKKNEADVYLCLLQNPGGLHVQEITNKTEIKRSTVNLVLERLISRGFVIFRIDETWKVYIAEDPNKILYSLQQTAENFKDILPLLSVSNFGGKKSKIRFFEGEDSVLRVQRDMILSTKHLKPPKEVLAISSGKHLYEALGEGLEWFVKNRIKTDLYLRWIAPDNELTRRRFVPTLKEDFRDIKFFDEKKYPFDIQINVYANCVALISLKSHKSAAIIENSAIANSFRALFNLLWDSLK